MNTESILFKCCFCGGEHVTEYVPNPIIRLEKWLNKLACNRCSDFQAKRKRIEDRVLRLCRKLEIARNYGTENLGSVESVVRDKLTVYSRDYARAVCDYRNMETVWESDFVDQLMNKPDRAFASLRFYLRNITNVAKLSQPA